MKWRFADRFFHRLPWMLALAFSIAPQFAQVTRIMNAGDRAVAPARDFLTHPLKVEARPLHARFWTPDDGLLPGEIRRLLISKTGHLWVGGIGGLARFDGHSFWTLTREQFPDLPPGYCTDLAETSDKTLWIGTRAGLCFFKDGRLTRAEGELRDQPIHSICPTSDGAVFLSVGDSLREWRDGKLTPVRVSDDSLPQVGIFFEDSKGNLWFGGNGLWRRHKGQSQFESLSMPVPIVVWAIAEGPDGAVWFGGEVTYSVSHLLRERDGVIEKINGLEFIKLRSLAFDRNGKLWIVSDSGLYSYPTLEQRTFTDSPWPALAKTAIADPRGGLWMGGDRGLIRISSPAVQTQLPPDRTSPDTWSASAGAVGVWTATADRLTWQNGTNFLSYGLITREKWELPVASWILRALWADPQRDEVWVGGGSGAVFRLFDSRDGEFQRIELMNVHHGVGATGFTRTRAGTLLMATSHGVLALDETNRTWTRFHGTDWHASGVFEARDGGLWVGSFGHGIAHIKNDSVRKFTTADGLPGSAVGVAHEDAAGAIWIVGDAGVTRFKNGQFRTISKEQGLIDNVTLALLEDNHGNYWFNSYRGVFKAPAIDLNAAADGHKTKVRCIAYGMEDGALSLEGNAIGLPNSCRAPDGKLWFPTTAGAVIVDPDAVIAAENPPPVLIEEFQSGDRNILPASVDNMKSDSIFEIPPGGGRKLAFRFTAVDLNAGHKVAFKYRLEGHDHDWIDAGNQRVAFYAGVKPGTYRFHVLAASRHGLWNDHGAAVSFKVRPFLYQTIVFQALASAAVVGIIWATVSYRSRLQKKILRLQHEADLLRERERIARDMHDDLGARLTRIAMLSDSARADGDAREKILERLAENAREAVDGMGDVIWSANPAYDSVESLIAYLREYAMEFFEGSGIACEFELPSAPDKSAPPQVRRAMLLVLKEALNNIRKHSKATQVRIEANWREREFELVVCDNGAGFAAGALDLSGHGLTNMRKRMEDLGGSLIIRSSAAGTELRASAPLAVF